MHESHVDPLNAADIARAVVNELFLRLGIDVRNPDDIKALQADLAYMRKARTGSEDLLRLLRRSAITVAVSAVAYALWEGLIHLVSFGSGR